MSEIVTSVKQVTDIMAEIAAASQEQLSGIEQVSRAVTQMDKVVQQNAALVEQSASSAEHMNGQAAALVKAVERFKLGDERVAPEPRLVEAPAAAAPAPRAPSEAPRVQPSAPRPAAKAIVDRRPAEGAPRAKTRAAPLKDDSDGDWQEF